MNEFHILQIIIDDGLTKELTPRFEDIFCSISIGTVHAMSLVWYFSRFEHFCESRGIPFISQVIPAAAASSADPQR